MKVIYKGEEGESWKVLLLLIWLGEQNPIKVSI